MTAVVDLVITALVIWRAVANLVARGHRIAAIRVWRLR